MMEKRYSGFLIAFMLIACKLLYCNAFLESPVKKKYVPNIRLKEEILKLAKDSVTEGILKVRRELTKNLEDLRLDMMRRDVELYEEIYTVKENLTGNVTAKEKHTTNLDDGERKVWIKKFECLEAGIKKTTQDSKINADTLQENMERLNRENRRILFRMDTMEISVMRVASVNLNDSEELIFTNYLQKLQYEDERLNNINETMQDICNSNTEMQKAIGTFQSEVLTLKSSIDALNVHVNLIINDNTIAIQKLADLSENIQLNMTKVLNENEQYFSKELLKLMRNVSEVYDLSTSNLDSLQDLLSQEKQLEMQVNHSRQDLKSEMTVLKNQLNFTVTNFEDMKDKQISNDLINISLKISFISDAWNATNEELGILNNSLYGKLTDFKTQVQLVFKENLNQSEQLTNITATVNDLQRQVYDIVQQLTILEAEKKRVSILTENVTDHKSRLQDVVNGMKSNSRTISDIQSNMTAFMEIHKALNRSLSQQVSEGTQQKRNVLILRVKLQNLQDNLSGLTVVSNNLKSQFNSTEERIEDLQRITEEKNNSDIIQKRNLAEKIESIQQNVSSLDIFVQLESNERKDLLNIQKQRYLNIMNVIESIQYQMNSTVQQQMTLEADKEHLLLLKKNITDHEQRIGNIVNIAQTNSDTLSRIKNNITALIEITGALNWSLSRHITERNQQLRVRLVGGRAAGEGRVEIYHSNAWGTICDDRWDNSDARVVCRMLGYSGSYTAVSNARFGQGAGQIWLDEVGCSGSESTIFSCRSSGWGVHNCSHGEDASVKCT